MKVVNGSVVLLLAAGSALADVYLHAPRGSNNRLAEKTANRNNGNRCFNSQNNNKGGYNHGDIDDQSAAQNFAQDVGGTATAKGYLPFQYKDEYELGSYMHVEWTNQHGCGVDENGIAKTDCQIIVQVMCDGDDVSAPSEQMANGSSNGRPNELRGQTGTDATPTTCQHEPASLYQHCKAKRRNKGLFTADQRLKGDTAIYTRQNPNANRRGLECDEERDYHPYWGVTPWVDLAILTNNVQTCPAYIQQSQNLDVNRAWWCVKNTHATNDYHEIFDNFCEPTNEAECNAEAGCTWAKPKGIFGLRDDKNLPAPLCFQAPKSRVNQLGNSDDGHASSVKFRLPKSTAFQEYTQGKNCVLRLRYNITTYDYEAWDQDLQAVVNATHNNNNMQAAGLEPLIEQNPTVSIDEDLTTTTQGFKLAINTAQFGRTFQDRTHVMKFVPASPDKVEAGGSVLNLYVKGKRGNIVQTFPSVEYDFTPQRLKLCERDRVNFQYAGSNTHNNQNPAGDGQAGDAGEGRGGTDRHNMVELMDEHDNYPMPVEQSLGSMFSEMSDDCVWHLLTGGLDTDESPDNLLNDSKASWGTHLGADCGLKFKAGSYNYMNTRNNNFSNRSQKGNIVVRANTDQRCDYMAGKNPHRDDHFCGNTQRMAKESKCGMIKSMQKDAVTVPLYGDDGWPVDWL